MLKVTLEIDNKTAHSCSLLKFLEKYIFQNATCVDLTTPGQYSAFDTPYAKIVVRKIQQL